MHFIIQRSLLGGVVKEGGSNRACLLGQIARQMSPEAYAKAPIMSGSSNAIRNGVVPPEMVNGRGGSIFDASELLRGGHRVEDLSPSLTDLFPGHTLEVID